MNKLEIVLCDSNNDGNLKYRYTVLDPSGRVIVMTSSLFLAEMYLKK
jgi:hypothetical protein